MDNCDDNCRSVANAGQDDGDQDGVGDACDSCFDTPPGEPVDGNGCSCNQYDDDNDGVGNCADNCRSVANSGQEDGDQDGLGDACDACLTTPAGEPVDGNGCSCSELDEDGDGMESCSDNCRFAPNGPLLGTCTSGLTTTCLADSACDTLPETGDGLCSMNQENSDTDFHGDACDNCPDVHNPDQADLDRDGRGDACDPDADGDGWPEVGDNCPRVPNPEQTDSDNDGVGDCCDTDWAGWADADQDGVHDGCDICPGGDDTIDTDGDGVPDGCDACPGGDDNVDTDGDGVADFCDPCPLDNPDDPDGDGLCSSDDNCPNHANPDQLSPLGPPLLDPLVPDAGFGTKNRYISFVTTNLSEQAAVRVTLTGLPAPYDTYDGLTMWVGPPVEVSENAGKVDPADAPGFPTFWAATLQCDAYYTDWSEFPVVHIYDETIVPSGVYDLQAIALSCQETSESSYSAPLTVTQSQWGDVISDCATTPCGPPDGVINVTTDVTATLNKFKNLAGAPIKARSDLDLSLPDQKINISDVTLCLSAFGGFPYPFTPGPPPPPCP